MNALLHWLTAPEWSVVVRALLHTLWQAALLAILLSVALRRSVRPATRYYISLASLAAVVVAGVFSWALLSRSLPAGGLPKSNPARADAAFISEPREVSDAGEPTAVVAATRPAIAPLSPEPSRWTAWLALVWVAGAGLMFARAAIQVAGAERLRRSGRPLEDPRVIQLLAEARNALRLARQIRVTVTDRLTSPAVVGVLVPTLILPLSLLTTLTPDQIRFILLHELAHIRRGDYLANLFQLFAEALLFFNPAVWWISHQVRREREACCDALAIELCRDREPVDYAQTLVHVAENVLNPPPAAAPAFGSPNKGPSSLHDRIQRLLVPGYRPALRLSWRAMLTALLLGGTLLVLSAVGTRLTVAAILSPQQRIEQIEKKMTEYGQKPGSTAYFGDYQTAPKVSINGSLRTSDGSPLPRWVYVYGRSVIGVSSYGGTSLVATNGSFTFQFPQGDIYVNTEVSNFAPAIIGPLNGRTNQLAGADIILDRGFPATIRVVEAGSGLPISGATLQTLFCQRPGNSSPFHSQQFKAGDDGVAVLEHCTDLPLQVIASTPGYEIVEQRFETLKPGEELQIVARRGAMAAGEVRDRNSGGAIGGATVQLVFAKGQKEQRFDWTDPLRRLATTTADGRFLINQLQHGATCSLAITAPGYETVVLDGVRGGQTNLTARLGPEQVVRGSITGTPDALQAAFTNQFPPQITFWVVENVAGREAHIGSLVPVRIDADAGHFQFTNRVAGLVKLEVAGHKFERTVDGPVDWQVNLAEVPAAAPPVKREVVFRLQHASGVPPRGTLKVLVPLNLDPSNPSAENRDMEIQNGEVHVELAVGGYTAVEAAHLVGYWFNDIMGLVVTNGSGPMVVNVPLIPAGAIFAQARNADGRPASGLLFSVEDVKRSPLVNESYPSYQHGDGSSGGAPRKFVSHPLPLGGVYCIVGTRGNAFCVSEPVKLTEEKPDQEVELQFPAGRPLDGQVVDLDGKPLRGVKLSGSFTIKGGFGHGLESVLTDDDGRFRFEDTTPQSGNYRLQIEHAPGWLAEFVDVDFKHLPLVIQLKPGLKITGRVVEVGTGYVIPSAEIRAFDPADKLPAQTTRTDADGHFEFNTLGDANYRLFVDGASVDNPAMNHIKAGSGVPITIEAKLWPGEQLKSRPPAATNAAASVPTNGTRILTSAGRQNILKKLNTILIERFASDDRPLPEVLRKLAEQAKQADPEKTGVEILIKEPISNSPGGAPIINPATGMPVPSTSSPAEPFDINKVSVKFDLENAYLRDALDAIVLTASRPIRYSILDDAVTFSPKGKEPELHTRKFHMGTNFFSSVLKTQTGQTGNGSREEYQEALFKLLPDLGAVLSPESGANLYVNNVDNTIVVRATTDMLDQVETIVVSGMLSQPGLMVTAAPSELDKMERAVERLSGSGAPATRFVALSETDLPPAHPLDPIPIPQVTVAQPTAKPPEINIKTRFTEVPESVVEKIRKKWPATQTTTNGVRVLTLTSNETQEVMKEIRQVDKKPLGVCNVTTADGRRAQIQMVDVAPILVGINPAALTSPGIVPTMETNDLFPAGKMSNGKVVTNDLLVIRETAIGKVVNFLPTVDPDGRTVQLTVSPQLTEFLGYDKPAGKTSVYVNGKKTKIPEPAPRFRARETSVQAPVEIGSTLLLEGFVTVETFKGKDGKTQSKEVAPDPKRHLLVFVTPSLVPAGTQIDMNAP